MGGFGKGCLVAALAAACLPLPSGASAASSVSVGGNQLVDGGKPIRLIGVNRSGSEYACAGPVGGGGFGDTNCTSHFSNKVMKFADRTGISYLAWTWNAVQDYGGCSNELLDSGRKGKAGRAYLRGLPSGYGRGVRAHFRKVKASKRF
jgi:hypothetical protein